MTRIREPDLEPPLASCRGSTGMEEHAFGTARRMAHGLRALANQAAPGEALGLVDAVAALFTRTLRFDAADPHWPDRDRIVLSGAGGGPALLGAVLGLTGHAGLPAIHLHDHPAVEAVPGPPGQCLGVAVGMAMAERLLAARFGRSLVDHRTWVLASATDLAGGISHEAAELAGHLALDRLTVLWDDDGSAEIVGTDELKRFAACGWTTRRVDGRDTADLALALALAERSRKPTLIACTMTAEAPEADLPPFTPAPELQALWEAAGARGAAARRGWKKRATRHALRAEFERVIAGRLPDEWLAALRGSTAPTETGAEGSTLDASRQVAVTLVQAIPELVGGGAAGLVPIGLVPIGPGRFGGQSVAYGARPQGMAACTAGLALHGGVVPFAYADLSTADAVRPALRLLAAARQRAVYVLFDDGAEPEQLAVLRTVPGLHLHRPADAAETAECWELALRRTDGPSVVVLCGQDGPALRTDTAENRCARGGYVLAEADGPCQATLIACGAEVRIAMNARAELAAAGIPVAVVSLPCWDLFAQLPAAESAQVLGEVPRAGISPGDASGLERWLGADGIMVGGDPQTVTAGAVASAIIKRLPMEEEKVA